MSGELLLDTRGLCPPEPMERVLEALADLRPGQSVRMLLDREPRPLYAILRRDGYAYATRIEPDGTVEVLIRQGG
jgi:uncharacterized protein (DUF2249 family)